MLDRRTMFHGLTAQESADIADALRLEGYRLTATAKADFKPPSLTGLIPPEPSPLQVTGTPYRFGYTLPDGLPTYAIETDTVDPYQVRMALAASIASLSDVDRATVLSESNRVRFVQRRTDATPTGKPNRYRIFHTRQFPKRYRHKIADNRFVDWRIGDAELSQAVLAMLRYCTCKACITARKAQRLAVGLFGTEYMPLHNAGCACGSCQIVKGEHVVKTYCKFDKLAPNELGDIV